MTRLRSVLVSTIGVSVVALSLGWDLISGDTPPHFGRRQAVGCLFGAVILLFGLMPASADRRSRFRALSHLLGLSPWRWLAALALGLAPTGLTLLLPQIDLPAAFVWFLWCYYAAVCLILPARFGTLLLVSAVVLTAFLATANSIKVSLTGLPLTMLDLQIATTNPAGLWDALQLPDWTRPVAIGLLVLAAAYVVWTGVAAVVRGIRAVAPQHAATKSALRGVIVVGIAALTGLHFKHLFAQLDTYRSTWAPQGVAAMAAEIGVVPYLAYSRYMQTRYSGDYFSPTVEATPPAAEEIRAAVLRHIEFDSTPGRARRTLPNIVVLLAESTFDPNRAFKLNRKVDSMLFSVQDDTAATGLLFVNVIGGGTWVTEFESIVGLDSRLFGYSGYYTHASISPYVSRSLATYLKSHGYRTQAFFPHDGAFYNYRNAYRAYGFDEIIDSYDLGRGDGWLHSDTDIVADFKRFMGPRPGSPFFSYVLLIENHGPHKCKVSSTAQMPVHLAGTEEFTPNCALHEYLRRLQSTDSAVRSLVDYLRELERRDGRPYVVLVFGDHQPFTFTNARLAKYDYDPFRTTKRKDVTFFHLLTSIRGSLRCCLTEVPATLLPTLVSAYVADAPDDVYLGMNLWLYDQCGADAVGSRLHTGLFRYGNPTAPTGLDHRSSACAAAYAEALAGYRQSGILRFGDGAKN